MYVSIASVEWSDATQAGIIFFCTFYTAAGYIVGVENVTNCYVDEFARKRIDSRVYSGTFRDFVNVLSMWKF